MSKNSKTLFTLILLLYVSITAALAAECQTQAGTVAAPANFNSTATWSCGRVPTTGWPGPDNITINHPIYYTGTMSATWVTQLITINSGGSLKITGDLNLAGSNARVVVNGGTLEVTGTLSIDGQSRITVQNGGVVKAGNVTLSNSAQYVNTSGTLTLGGSLSALGGTTFTYPNTLAIPGSLTLGTGTTLAASTVGGAITLTNSSKLSLTTTPSATLAPSGISIGDGSELVYSGGTLNYSNPLTVGSNAKLTITSGTFKPQSLTVDAGTVTVTGGNLAVTNALTLQGNNATVNFSSSGVLSAASVSLTSSGNNKNLNLTAGSMAVTNSVDIQSKSTINTSAGTTSTASSLTVDDNSNAILNNGGTFTVNGNVAIGGKINNNGNMHITGSLNSGSTGNAIFTNNGSLNVNSVSMISSARFQVNPGATTFVDTNFTVNATQNLVIGTNVNPPPYADMVIRGNLNSTNGGDVLVERNARFAIFGDVTGEGSGNTRFTINPGGEVYIDKSISFSGGGDRIINNNPSTPTKYGLYIDGEISNTGGGAQSTTNYGDKDFMESTNKPFFDWVASVPNGPLPVVLSYFRFGAIATGQIPLQWATTLEKNFDHFEIERAGETFNFSVIATVANEGNEQQGAAYTFVDDSPQAGWNYYRLKQVDLDGTVVYSDVIRTHETVTASSGVSLYPNPAKEQQIVTLSLQDYVTTPASLTFIDGAGRVLLEVSVDASVTAIPLPTHVTAGIYAVRLASASGQKLFRLVIQ
ncbi:T9SS type A sorting domain-containing protein [Dawidia soli]|uniref:T9SS type A sorting domain-containing protein n=1 Tax=Dawidia soli TaxID=2782352 RepID=A0AAP2GI12_9BACT|nr:T9SS type A sorting domain-containing protein [Dawidia soli]MBT1687756.1 T9SS type A sorting domain-containing protein [Dawidia soli]